MTAFLFVIIIYMKIGFAKDIHNLIDNDKKPLVLGGYEIKNHNFSIQAVSDGDVILHSVTSAILGALGLNTLGEYFPDTNKDNTNRTSLDFINFALSEMHQLNLKIISLDICIVCEHIMLKDYLNNIRLSLKDILKIDSLGIKCTRFEDKNNFKIESYCSLIIS